MIIKQFEAFNSKDISSISKFLRNMNGDSACEFISDLTCIAEELDKPVSIFKGKYMSSKSASAMESKDKPVSENYLKFWFSLKDGYVSKTISRKNSHSTYSSNIMNESGIVDEFQMNIIKDRFYDKGVIYAVDSYRELKTGDEVIFIPSVGSNPISAVVYIEKDDEVIQMYLLQNTFKDTVKMVNSEEILKRYNKYYSYRIYRKYIEDYDKEFKIGHISILKYKKTNDDIHQDLSNVSSDVLNKIFFLNNNKVCNPYLRTLNWTNDLYDKFRNVDYALVIDLEDLDDVKLSDIRDNRNSNTPNPIKNDEYYRRINIKRWVDKLGRTIKSKMTDKELEKIKYMLKCGGGYRNNDDLINTLLDMYRDGQLTKSQLGEILGKYY